MDRTEKPRSTGGWRWLIRGAEVLSFPISSMGLSLLLVTAQLSRPGVVAIAVLLAAFGVIQLLRAKARLRDRQYEKMQMEVRMEVGFARLWILTGAILAAFGLLLPPIVTAVLGIVATLRLPRVGWKVSGRSVDAERVLGLAGRSAAEECGKVRSLANDVARILRWPVARRAVDFANLKVKPNEIGVIQTLILGVMPIVFLAYSSLALAIGVSAVTELPTFRGGAKVAQPDGSPPRAGSGGKEDNGDDFSAPTYAESCPQIPEPLDIGHDLGSLFRRDGAAKAGCGDWAIKVAGTGAWVAAGNCEDELRSVAVSSPGHRSVILYGEPARIAWSSALNGELVSAEAARPAGGDVYLLETLAGTSAFARPSPSIEPGRNDLEVCSEASGVARPFVELAPPLAFLWLELVRDREAWYWPESDLSDPDSPIAFVDGGDLVARGGCEAASCHLDVEGERWPGGETAFVSLAEFRPYMPATVE